MRRLAGFVAALSCAWSSFAHAESASLVGSTETNTPSDARTAEAREDFRRASALAQVERWSEALELYASSYRRYPHATTLYNLGYCFEKLERPAEAYRSTRAALELSRREPGKALSPERMEEARLVLEELVSRTGRLELPPHPERVSVEVDGAPLVAEGGMLFAESSADAPRSEFREPSSVILNPGRRRVLVKSGARAVSLEVEILAGVTTPFSWPDLAPPPAEAPSKPAPPPRTSAPASASRAVPSESGLRPWTTASFALGAGAAVIGLGAGIVAWSAKSDLDDACDAGGGCPASEEGTLSRFETSATVANVSLAIAVLSSATGVTLLWLGDSSSTGVKAGVGVRYESGRVEIGGRF